MKLLKPGWVAQDDHPIFSVDIHPSGTKFATGGQGEDCGRVTVWNMAPILNPKLQKDSSVPKMLCQMDNHLACVNSVRWSGSGKYLASAGDDQRVILWTKSAYGGGAVFGGGGKVNHESYRVAYTLRIHDGDVLDIAWSPGDVWLATASVDNTVVVWDVEKLPSTVAILKGHTGHVKGVTWDPVGKYLATQSADKTLRVWRTSDWGEEANVSEPFEECGGTTHVLRLDWSPDGQYLVSAHAMNGGGPTAQILERDGWKFEKDFVGHRKAVTCVRFNDNIFEKYLDDVGKKAQYVCLAIGSRDRSLSVWLTSLKRPLFVIHDVFESSILDLAWSKDGLVLLACSMDGSVAAVVLNEKELGTPMNKETKNSLLKKIYGQNIGPAQNAKPMLIENPELLKLAQNGGTTDNNDSEVEVVPEVNGASRAGATPTKRGPTDKQLEMRTSDGRRRITPIYILPNTETTNQAVMNGNSMSSESFGKYQMQSSSSEAKSKIRVEKLDGVVEPNVSPGKKTSPGIEKSVAASVAPKSAPAAPNKPNMIAIKHKPGPVNTTNPVINSGPVSSASTEVKTSTATDSSDSQAPKVNMIQVKKAPGKSAEPAKKSDDEKVSKKKHNRIESSSSESDSSDSDSSSSSSDDETASQTSKSGADTDLTGEGKPKPKPDAVASSTSAPNAKPSIMNNKRKADDVPSSALPPAKKRGRPPSSVATGTVTPILKTAPTPVVATTLSGPPPAPIVQPALPPSPSRPCPGLPPISLTNNRQNHYFTQHKVNSIVLNIFIQNDHHRSAAGSLHRISIHTLASITSPLVWELILPSPITCVLSSPHHLLLSCRDATLHLLSSTGSRLLPPVSLPSPPHKLTVSPGGDLLACVTTNARLFIWKLEKIPKVVIRNEEIGPLNRINKKQSISLIKISFSRDKQPVLSLSDGSVHTFSPDLGCWVQLVPARSCPTNLKLSTGPPSISGQPLAQLSAGNSGLMLKLDEKTEISCITSSIESKLSSSLYIGSSGEYRYWLGALVKNLAKGGHEVRLRSILDDLLGPPDRKETATWKCSILGTEKKRLLEEVLPYVATNMSLQRLYTEYKGQVKEKTDLFC